MMNVVLATLLQRTNRTVTFTTFSRCQYYDVASTLRQSSEEYQIGIIQDRMIAFPQLCLKAVLKRFTRTWHVYLFV